MTNTDDQAAAPTPEQLDDARAAYAAYGQTTGGRNFRGEPMPTWDGLGDTIQRAWIAAAAAVRARAVPAVRRGLPTDEDRERLCQWLRANGLDPDDMPADSRIDISGDKITVDVFIRDDDGNYLADRGRPVRTTRTVPLVVPR